MDQYILIITKQATSINFELGDCHTLSDIYTTHSGIYSSLVQRTQRYYIKWIEISDCENGEKRENWVKYIGANVEDYKIKTTLSGAMENLFSLAESLPIPGSYVLDVYWIPNCEIFEDMKKLAPLLGVLKKLREWHLGNINFIYNSDQSLKNMEAASRFIAGNLIQVDQEQDFVVKSNRNVVWRGSMDITLPDESVRSIVSGFTLMLPHNEERSLIDRVYSKDGDDKHFLWFGNVMKALEFIDIDSVPLILWSGHELLLGYSKQDDATCALQEAFMSNTRIALLCRLDYITSDKNFTQSSEFGTKQWKDVVRKSPDDLAPPVIKLYEKMKPLFLLITSCTHSCTKYPNTLVLFSAFILNNLHDLNAGFLLDHELSGVHDSSAETGVNVTNIPSINAPQLFGRDPLFARCFRKALDHWNQLKKDKISPKELQKFVSEFWAWFEDFNNLKTENSVKAKTVSLVKKETISLELSAILNQEKQAYAVQSKQDKGLDSLRSSNPIPDAASKFKSIETNEILKYFDKNARNKVVANLRSMNKGNSNTPSISNLEKYTSAIGTSYHGVSFNIDAQASEKHDRMCRRTVEKFVKYETMSVASKHQVPSPVTMNINDSPHKPKRPVHTPRKKKRLQIMAEKLYKKRVGQANLPAHSMMVLRSTPKKRNPNNSKVLLASPRVHKMSLRSSTPVKKESVSKLTAQNESKQTETKPVGAKVQKRDSQKLYVQDNKKRLWNLVVQVLNDNGVSQKHPKFKACSTKLYNVSMAFLKDLKTSKGLAKMMQKTVEENAKLVLSFEIS
nr:mdm2-binding protein [Ciona intestinalis]|eukprot:XP_026695928.1 mdm2-binding protein [Ciona intestinalis]